MLRKETLEKRGIKEKESQRKEKRRRSKEKEKGIGEEMGLEETEIMQEIKKLRTLVEEQKRELEGLRETNKEKGREIDEGSIGEDMVGDKGMGGRRDESEEEEESEEDSEIEIRRREERKTKRKGIVLPKLKGEDITEEEMRRFVFKAKEKLMVEGNVKRLLGEMSSALLGRASDIYYAFFSEDGTEVRTKKDMKKLMKYLMDSVTEKKNVKVRCLELQEKGQNEKETVRMWGNTVKSKLSTRKTPDHVMTDTFVNGLKSAELRRKMKKRLAREDEIKLDRAIAIAEQINAGLAGMKGDSVPKRTEEDRVVAPVFTINIDAETCNRIVNTATSYVSGRSNAPIRERENVGPNRRVAREENSDKCWRCAQTGHRAFECNNDPVCYKCNRPGHRAVECRAEQCDHCGKQGHTRQRCWALNPLARRGGEARGRGRGYIRGRGILKGGGSRQDRRVRFDIGRGGSTVQQGEQTEGGVGVSVQQNNKEAKEYDRGYIGGDGVAGRKATAEERRAHGKEGRSRDMRRRKRLRRCGIRNKGEMRGRNRRDKYRMGKGVETMAESPEEMERMMTEVEEEENVLKEENNSGGDRYSSRDYKGGEDNHRRHCDHRNSEEAS